MQIQGLIFIQKVWATFIIHVITWVLLDPVYPDITKLRSNTMPKIEDFIFLCTTSNICYRWICQLITSTMTYDCQQLIFTKDEFITSLASGMSISTSRTAASHPASSFLSSGSPSSERSLGELDPSALSASADASTCDRYAQKCRTYICITCAFTNIP